MIFATIADWLVKLGLSSTAAKRITPYAFVAAILLGLVAAFGAWLHFHDRKVVQHVTDHANVQALQKTINANETASAEQSADEKSLSAMQKGYDDALNHPPPGASSDARVRLACQRLRNAGYREADLPAVCAHAGSGGPGTKTTP